MSSYKNSVGNSLEEILKQQESRDRLNQVREILVEADFQVLKDLINKNKQ